MSYNWNIKYKPNFAAGYSMPGGVSTQYTLNQLIIAYFNFSRFSILTLSFRLALFHLNHKKMLTKVSFSLIQNLEEEK